MTAKITREELKRRIDAGDDLTLAEALPARYYARAHLPGALNLPHDRVDELAPSLLPGKDRTVVVYCASAACRNSGIAAEALRRLGYTDVLEYVEGKEDWIAAGHPVERVRASA